VIELMAVKGQIAECRVAGESSVHVPGCGDVTRGESASRCNLQGDPKTDGRQVQPRIERDS
jgi:hypothetical protein